MTNNDNLNLQQLQQQQQLQPLAGVAATAQASKRRKVVCPSSVVGKIIVTDLPTGEKISQWAGVECYLSFISGHGPCLVVRSSKHKKGDGTFFQLRLLEKVFHQQVEQGKLSLQIPHQKRQCMIFITVTDVESLPQLALMATTLDDRRRWSDLEVNVGRGYEPNPGGKRGRKRADAGDVGEQAEVVHTRPEARDALLMQDHELNFS